METSDAGSLHSRRRVSTAGSEDPLPMVRLPARHALRTPLSLSRVFTLTGRNCKRLKYSSLREIGTKKHSQTPKSSRPARGPNETLIEPRALAHYETRLWKSFVRNCENGELRGARHFLPHTPRKTCRAKGHLRPPLFRNRSPAPFGFPSSDKSNSVAFPRQRRCAKMLPLPNATTTYRLLPRENAFPILLPDAGHRHRPGTGSTGQYLKAENRIL